jgi:hypothetical protein
MIKRGENTVIALVYILVMVIIILYSLNCFLICYSLLMPWAPCNTHCDEDREYWGKCKNDIYIHSLQHYNDVLFSRKTKLGMALHTHRKVEKKFHYHRIYSKLVVTFSLGV